MTTGGIGTEPPVSRLSREEIAHLEVGHTSVTPGLARTLVVWFLATLAALPVIELSMASRDPGGPPAWTHLMSVPRAIGERLDALRQSAPDAGPWTRIVTANRAVLAGLTAFEAALEDESPVGRLLRPPTQVILTGWLGTGNERVYAGRDRWLFYRTDVEYVTGQGFLDPRSLQRRALSGSEFETPPQPDPRPAIRLFKDDLDARGITLILIPTPVKPTVHPERLARGYERDAGSLAAGRADASIAHNVSHAAFVDALRRDGVLVFDPSDEMASARSQSGDPQYLATDTHWRPETMQRVAAALVAFLRVHTALPELAPAGYRAEPREARQIGDIAAMLDLPAGQTLYPPERVPLRFVVRPDGDPWRPSRDADVLVLGDSFSNMYSLATMGWGEAGGFVEQISYLLQRPIDRIVQNDQGAHATRALLAREVGGSDDRLSGKRVVIWQFAARELAFGDWRPIAIPPPRVAP